MLKIVSFNKKRNLGIIAALKSCKKGTLTSKFCMHTRTIKFCIICTNASAMGEASCDALGDNLGSGFCYSITSPATGNMSNIKIDVIPGRIDFLWQHSENCSRCGKTYVVKVIQYLIEFHSAIQQSSVEKYGKNTANKETNRRILNVEESATWNKNNQNQVLHAPSFNPTTDKTLPLEICFLKEPSEQNWTQ